MVDIGQESNLFTYVFTKTCKTRPLSYIEEIHAIIKNKAQLKRIVQEGHNQYQNLFGNTQPQRRANQ